IVADDELNRLRQHTSVEMIRVAFKEPLEAEWLRRLEGVNNINKVDTYTWTMETNDAELVRKQLVQLSLQHNLNIVSLHSENKSLEEVFRSLTSR
ncbi:MAG TPA: DUF4162 domain-containing protein, partial [Flavisolibacter sp.]